MYNPTLSKIQTKVESARLGKFILQQMARRRMHIMSTPPPARVEQKIDIDALLSFVSVHETLSQTTSSVPQAVTVVWYLNSPA